MDVQSFRQLYMLQWQHLRQHGSVVVTLLSLSSSLDVVILALYLGAWSFLPLWIPPIVQRLCW